MMSDDNSDSAPSNDTRGGVGGAGEEARQGPGSPGLSGGSSSSDTDRKRGAAPGSVSKARGASRGPQKPGLDDTDAQSSGNDSGERDSEGRLGREASRGRQSTCSSQFSSSHNGKDSAIILETTESNKSSNSHSPSPPSSSVAYSLLSASSEQDHPSTSGCSSEQSARRQTQKELMKALKELKIRVPLERRGKGRSSTLASLQYALNCVKQVRANQEYYHQWSVEESHGCSFDLSTFTIEELDNITSEYNLKNTDTFSVAISFVSGKVVYISPQASSLLRCKPERLQGALFSELLAPQDVSTFYSSTAPSRLPLWAACTGSVSSPMDCTQEKSMFCRISGGGRDQDGGVRYYPFRLTPYQLTLRDSDVSDAQPCCLLIAERVHSGYEAPRIPADKRVFTTSHTPSCLFQEVDERAVPLLGYLPQDLVGTPVLLYLHPEDRPVMVAIHKKILQFAGQPFEHSPLRLCARSGEYLTIDTSWSSFVNPWSRKVAFIVGRHKVRTSPLNEDVFTAPQGGEGRGLVPEIGQLCEQIHRLLVQPVHSGSSQGYCSLGSNGSHELHASAASSSDSAAATEEPTPLHKPMTFQQICKDVHMVKTSGQQVFIDSRNRPPPRKHASTAVVKTVQCLNVGKLIGEGAKLDKLPPKAELPPPPERRESSPNYSYQQINCLDSIIRYLESCNVPNTVKRKCGSSSGTTSSTSDDDKQKDVPGGSNVTLDVAAAQKGAPQGPAHTLSPMALHSKADSVVSVTSQCSFSSTIVHVGDKKPPESDIVMEETPPTPTPAPPTPVATPAVVAAPTPTPPSPAAAEREGREGRRGGAGRLGLTKEVLLAHTQKEEQHFLGRFRDLNQLRVFDPSSTPRLHGAQHPHSAAPFAKGVRSSRDYPAVGSSGRRRGRGAKRLKHQEGLAVRRGGGASGPAGGLDTNAKANGEAHGGVVFPPPHHLPLGPQTSSSSWPASVGSQTSLPPVPYPPVLPLYPLYPPLPHAAPDAHPPGFPNLQPTSRYPIQTPQLPSPIVPPMMAFVLPNYMFPHLNPALSHLNPALSHLNPALSQLNPALSQLNPALSQLNPALSQLNPALSQLNPALSQLNPALSQLNPALSQLNPALSHLNPALSQLNPALSQLNPALSQLSPALSQLNPALSQLSPALSQLNPALSQLGSSLLSAPQQFYNHNSAFPFLSPAPVPPHPIVPNPTTTTPTPRAPSRSSTPYSCNQPLPEREGVESPLFQSRCSSPLNLLQLEESPSNRLEAASALAAAQQTPPPIGAASQDWSGKQGSRTGAQASANRSKAAGDSKENENGEGNESSNQDVMSTSSDFLDLLLQEDSQSGTGSAASGSGSSGTGSNGCSTSGSGTRSSSNTSKYFGSIDSSENDHSRKKAAGGAGEEQFMKCVLQDPIWLLMANTDEKVMMTYQLPVRDREQVLREDRESLRLMQKHQPRFSEQQKRELSKVHPWIRTGRLPRAIDIPACVGCRSPLPGPVAAPFDVEIHDMELSSVLEPSDDGVLRKTPDSSTPFAPPETAMEEEEEEGKGGKGAALGVTHSNDQEMSTEEQEVTSQTLEEKGAAVTAMAL
ncbi:hypothetical protein SKAU_G00320510 [Synaphobranchus kaupii]|uniref:PAS domain-containing protein n=1 Tax=Synaphobranchus kaupii TaxID=118154 RepID=A0A9Q1ENN8_SYNKA|nr:hypothetical protein SKAU_G00320510 [Synaphobranchus kaupii]